MEFSPGNSNPLYIEGPPSINAVPEVPVGTIAASTAMIAALAALLLPKYRNRKSQPTLNLS